MAYKIPPSVKTFRDAVPLESFFILLCERRSDGLLVGQCVNHHPEHYDTYEAAIESAEKLITDKLPAVIYRAIPSSNDLKFRFSSRRRFEQWRIVDGVERMHSRPTAKERAALDEALTYRGCR